MVKNMLGGRRSFSAPDADFERVIFSRSAFMVQTETMRTSVMLRELGLEVCKVGSWDKPAIFRRKDRAKNGPGCVPA